MRFDDNPIQDDIVIKMRDSIAYRGPDGAGVYVNGRIALGHRRLSIIDLSDDAKQPFFSADGRYSITFNGEIYNYKEFIPELQKKGIVLRSSSDTEVLLYLYILYGPSMLNRLNGMWAFAIWDDLEKQLFLCRDRMGVKPLYYSIHKNAFYFASEQKAIFTAGVPLVVNEHLLYELFIYRYVAGENTLFRNVQKLLPGHYMTVTAGGDLRKERYWHLGERAQHAKIDGDPLEWFEYNFNKSIRYRMVSDVPVGVLLSAGLDSTCVAYSLYAQGYKNINTFTIGFREGNLNEANLTEKFARKINFGSHVLKVEGELLHQSLSKAIWSHDEPLIHQSDPHLVAISDYSKKYVKVLLSGEGSDELMGGYVRYKVIKYFKELNFLSSLLRFSLFNNVDRIKKLNRYLKNLSIDEAILLNASNFFPRDFDFEPSAYTIKYRQSVLDEAKEYVGNNPIKQALYFDQHTYLVSLLDRNDRATMAAGIECREPFLDYNLVEGLTSLPASYFVKNKKGKYILLNSIGKHLPQEIQQFRKIGLSTPWETYIREYPGFREVLLSLGDSEILNTSVFRLINKDKIVKQFFAGDNSNKMLIRFLFMLRLWEKEYCSKFTSYSIA